MFGKRREAPTVIGPGASIEGAVRVTGALHIDGEVRGTVEAKGSVSIGPRGVVDGEVHGESVAVAGNVFGVVYATGHLHMLDSGHVRGDVFYDTIQIDRGGGVDGRMTRVDEEQRALPETTQEGDEESGEQVAEVAELAAAGGRMRGA